MGGLLVEDVRPASPTLLQKIKNYVRWLLVEVCVTLLVLHSLALLPARLYLMVESYISLRKERVEIFQTPVWNWLDYIPHI